jgi:hydrogenase maturation protein HypF
VYKSEMTWRIRVYGIVQGVGFRPTVSRQATAHGIYGTVCNKGPYVEIYAQGKKEKIEGFLNELKENPPKRAAILKIILTSKGASFLTVICLYITVFQAIFPDII